MLEKDIERRIQQFLEEIGIFAFKVKTAGTYDPHLKVFRKSFNRFFRPGTSDIIGLLPTGQFLAIEVKGPKGRLSPDQKVFIKSVQHNNGIAFVSRSVAQTFEQLKPFIKEWKSLEHIVAKYAQFERVT